MRDAITIGRRSFIVGTAAALLVACADDEARPASSVRRQHRLALRGVNFDTDRDPWREEFVRREIEAIRNDLHANSILLVGSDLDRLVLSGTVAAEQGLHVWFEPRHFDSDATNTLAFATAVARAAEELRARRADVGLSLGVELTIFMDGLLPGSDFMSRATALQTTPAAEYNQRLNEFLADAQTAIRPMFGGQITYSSGEWEDVDWSGFDVVGVDLYRTAENRATYVQQMRDLKRHGKPVVITEFGCCTFRGAEDLGGEGFLVVDWWSDPVVIPDHLVRDEQVQARHIDELLDIYEAERLHGAFVWTFIEPGSPYSPDPRQDYDKVGFGIVKTFPTDHELAYERTGHFEPKAAFHTIARHFQ